MKGGIISLKRVLDFNKYDLGNISLKNSFRRINIENYRLDDRLKNFLDKRFTLRTNNWKKFGLTGFNSLNKLEVKKPFVELK